MKTKELITKVMGASLKTKIIVAAVATVVIVGGTAGIVATIHNNKPTAKTIQQQNVSKLDSQETIKVEDNKTTAATKKADEQKKTEGKKKDEQKKTEEKKKEEIKDGKQENSNSKTTSSSSSNATKSGNSTTNNTNTEISKKSANIVSNTTNSTSSNKTSKKSTTTHTQKAYDTIKNPASKASYFVWDQQLTEGLHNYRPDVITYSGSLVDTIGDSLSLFSRFQLTEGQIKSMYLGKKTYDGYKITNVVVSRVKMNDDFVDLDFKRLFNSAKQNGLFAESVGGTKYDATIITCDGRTNNTIYLCRVAMSFSK